MKLLILSILIGSANLTNLEASPTGAFRGIVCTAKEKINGIAPMVMIRDITSSRATLVLDFDGRLPDIREAVLDSVVNDGKKVVGYVSLDSEFRQAGSNFAVYTNGSTPEDTTQANLTFESNDLELKMECKNGMKL